MSAKRRSSSDSSVMDVVVETPKGSRCKYTFEPKKRAFKLKLVLPAGSVFPYDFGFIPNTLGEDGDPLDLLLLMDVPTFPGCLVEARLIGVIEAQQMEEGKVIRNDRLIAVSTEARDYSDLISLKQMNPHLQSEIEHFFVSYNELRGNGFTVLGRKGPAAALKLLKAAQKLARRKRS